MSISRMENKGKTQRSRELIAMLLVETHAKRQNSRTHQFDDSGTANTHSTTKQKKAAMLTAQSAEYYAERSTDDNRY